MIKEEYIYLKINNRNLNYYKDLGYDVKSNQICKIKIDDLTHGSHVKVTAICDICGKEKIIKYQEYRRNISKYDIFACCNKCALIKNKMTNLEKYNVEHFSKSIEFKKRVIESTNKKYNVDFYTQSEEYKSIMLDYRENHNYSEQNNKRIETNQEKYNVDYYQHSEQYKEKQNEIIKNYKNTINKKLLDKYDNLLFTDNTNYTFFCEKGHEFKISRELLKNRNKINTEICTVCNKIGHQKSGMEIQLLDFIKENYQDEILHNNRKILNNIEIDIFLPKLNIAFEFNGLYWHNELNKTKYYHYDKTEICEKNNIQLIHIYEDEWQYKQEIVKSMILNKMCKISNKIYARKCNIKIVGEQETKNFLKNNHLQGYSKSSIKIGLYFNNEIVSLMTFGKKRKIMNSKHKQNFYEMIRFCNKIYTNVIGGASKLFKYFINNYDPIEITTYADRSWSKGNLYKILGFDFINKTVPSYYYIIDNIRYYRFNFRKDILIKEGYDKNKSEHEIMLERKIFRIYNSGNLKFVYKK